MPGDNDSKTEQPTAKRKTKARRDGQVAKTPELSGWLIALVGSELIPHVFSTAYSRLTTLWGLVAQVITNPQPNAALHVLDVGLRDVATILFPTLAALVAVALVANLAQTRGLVSLHAAAPKFSHLNPISGMKRLFSTQSLWTLGKQILRLSLLVVVAYMIVSKLGRNLVGTRPVSLIPMLSYGGSTILTLIHYVAAMSIMLAIADYAWQRHQMSKQLKMTKQEVKEENRQSQGDPLIKGKIRGQQRKLSRARMMAAVIGADVIVTNPTHYAVALRYDAQSGRAPTVVAKGADELALRIREQAKSHKIPVVEDPPLARAVYAVCDIDDQIPHELYMAVARLLAFVFTLPSIVRGSGTVHRRPTSALVA